MSKETEVGITANAQPFTREMDRAAQSAITAGQRIQSAFREASMNMQNSMLGATDQIKIAMTIMTSVIAGGAAGLLAMSKQAIDAADGINDMSQRLGISVESIAGLKLASESSGMTLDSMADSVKRLSVYMTEHADKLAGIGITAKTSDEAMIQLADLFERMPDGVQKTALAMALMGRSGADMIPLLNGGGEALRQLIERGKELYPVTTEMAQDADAFNDKLQELMVGLSGVSIQVGKVMLPVLNNLISAWEDNIKQIGLMNGSLVALGQLGPVGQTIGVLWANVSFVFNGVGREIGGIAAQLAALSRLDLKGASAISDMMKRDATAARAELDNLERRIMGLSGKATATRQRPSGSSNAPGNVPDLRGIIGGNAKGNSQKSGGKQMSDTAWAMEEAAHLARTYHQLGEERAEAEEVSFARAMKAADEWETDLERGTKAAAEAAKRAAEQRTQVEHLWAQNAAAARLAVVDAAEAQARHAVDLGVMTNEELLAQDAEFEQQRNAIRAQALLDRLATVDPEKDPVVYAQILVTLQELERQHQSKMGEIRLQAAQLQAEPIKNIANGVEQSMAGSLKKLMQGQTTFAAFMRSIWKGVADAVIGELARIIAKKVVTWATERAMTIAGIGADAAKAGSGAASAVADIPYIGPVLAIAAMASVFAAVSGMSSKVPSAAQGYDIPAGLNPLTQLHEREMVLPAHLADAVRGMAGQGAGADAGGPLTVNINAVDDRSVRRLFMDNGPALADAIKAQARNFRT